MNPSTVTASAALFCLASGVAGSLAAAACETEQEPNDTPETALRPATDCLAGTISDGDGQDLWRWSVPPGNMPWQLRLDGLDTGLTNVEVIRLTRDNQGRVAKSETLYRFGAYGGSADSEPLMMTAGEYLLGVAAAGASGDYRVNIERLASAPGSETEPNDKGADGTPVTGAFALSGTGDDDYFVWTLGEQEAARRWTVTMRAPLGLRYHLQLFDDNGTKWIDHRHHGDAGMRQLHDLGLAAGSYLLRVSADKISAGSAYTLAAAPTGPRDVAFEEEPNPKERPGALSVRTGISGRLDEDGLPSDHFLLEPDPGLADRRVSIRLTADSEKKRKLCLLTVDDRNLQCREGTGSVEMPGLSLADPAYKVKVEGQPDPTDIYHLAFTLQDPFRPNEEREPNDQYRSATAMPGKAIRGSLAGRDTDVYRFETTGKPQLWRIQAGGTGLAQLSVLDAGGDPIASRRFGKGQRQARLSRLYLLPGTHYLEVQGENGDYMLRTLPQGEPDPNVENEPNDTESRALPIRFGQTRRGILPAGDTDYYRFRARATERVRLVVSPPEDSAINMRFQRAVAGSAIADGRKPGQPTQFEGTLLPGEYSVRLWPRAASEDAYSISLERLNPLADAVLPASQASVDLRLRLQQSQVAAYSTWQQRVEGLLSVANPGPQTQRVQIATWVSDAEVQLELARSQVDIAPAQSMDIPIEVIVPPDRWADVPLTLFVGATGPSGTKAFSSAEITPRSDAPAVRPEFAFRVPDALLGAIDVADVGLGGAPVSDSDKYVRWQESLHSHLAADAHRQTPRLNLHSRKLPLTLTVDLAGEQPQPVIGFAINPQGPHGVKPAATQVRDVALLLSSDGIDYAPVLTATLQPHRAEQFFALESPLPAHFAQLVIKSSYGSENDLVLESWKVLADPGALPAAPNLADPGLGGHLVSHDLASAARFDFAAAESPLTEAPNPFTLRCRTDCTASEFVVGFHHQRAAEIARVEWVEVESRGRLETVEVYASTETPVGPWMRAGAIAFPGASPGTRTLDFNEPVRARYLRFVMPAHGPVDAALPAVVRAFERAVDGEYRSILGQWGWDQSVSNAQRQRPPVFTLAADADDNDSIDTADPLAGPATGRVTIGRDEDFFRFNVPPQANTVRFAVGGRPSVRVSLELLDADAQTLPLVLDPDQSSPTLQHWEGRVEAGSDYWLRVHEPPRSVVFAWDTSGSVAPFRPVIYQALAEFAAGVTPGLEVVNLLPFEGGALLDSWEDEPTLIWRALQNFGRDSESSQTAATLLEATEILATRAGSKAVVLVGDMDLVDSKSLWTALQRVQPHIFPLRVAKLGGSNRGDSQMANWALVNGGEARQTPTIGDLAVGFDRAATRLRQPAPYELDITTTFQEPPGPGSLQVVSQLVAGEENTEPTVLGDTAVEIILDASGSMRQRLGNKRRIDIARETLINLTSNVLPPATPVALRVFGHLEGDYSCRTDLVQELQPLDAASLASTISALEPQNLAATPIGKSLALVADDLAGASGQKVIILVTDGEETCDGDPAAELDRISRAGIDVRVNIVGFAIDDAALKATFANWARIGGGHYYDAVDAAQLNAAMAQAVRVPFRVLGSDGGAVAAGVVNGEPVELPAGVYVVEVLAEPRIRYDKVIVAGERQQTLIVEH